MSQQEFSQLLVVGSGLYTSCKIKSSSGSFRSLGVHTSAACVDLSPVLFVFYMFKNLELLQLRISSAKFLMNRLTAAADPFDPIYGPTGSRALQNPAQVLNTLSSVSVRESRIQYLCDPQWFRDTASRGPTTIAASESQFRTCPSDHDSIGYPRMSASDESSTTMHRLLEGSLIDHQVTIYLHAQNITMFPTNETCERTPELDWTKIYSWNSKGTPKLVQQFTSRIARNTKLVHQLGVGAARRSSAENEDQSSSVEC
ncbi:hypothetical protein F511_10937 [Dorcoceras hygrometricum]|uniref:Uncharacterized protein n=1 Tax=Dorcoceras hygrometricum TaxID=472368 RepID=A0A2Z7APX0_9LAMI|nr:hypothetical protein F511_10937 [Dorcoceras hygrometricum]